MDGGVDRRAEKRLRKTFGRVYEDRDASAPPKGISGARHDASGGGAGRGPAGRDPYARPRSGSKDVWTDLLFITLVTGAAYSLQISSLKRIVVVLVSAVLYFRITGRMRRDRAGKGADTLITVLLIILILLALTILYRFS